MGGYKVMIISNPEVEEFLQWYIENIAILDLEDMQSLDVDEDGKSLSHIA